MVDYSVWDHIEVSDDEDETHPNIDTASLFRWRHQVRPARARLPREARSQGDRPRHPRGEEEWGWGGVGWRVIVVMPTCFGDPPWGEGRGEGCHSCYHGNQLRGGEGSPIPLATGLGTPVRREHPYYHGDQPQDPHGGVSPIPTATP